MEWVSSPQCPPLCRKLKKVKKIYNIYLYNWKCKFKNIFYTVVLWTHHMNASYSSSGTDCLVLSASPCCWLNVWRASSSSSSSLEASSAAWLERAGGTTTVPSAFWIEGFWQMYSGARPRLQISSRSWNTNKSLIFQPGDSPCRNAWMSRKSTFIMAVVASVFKVGWCLMSSSTALPKLDAVSPWDI